MSYQLLDSTDIQVFPFGKKRHRDPNARILNEHNITNLVRMLTDRKSYVVSYDAVNDYIEFVINGYLFRADLSALKEELKEATTVYACIDMGTTNDNYTYLQGGDSTGVVAGGTGTQEDPYILPEGTFTTVIKKPQGDVQDQDTYFKYTFTTEGKLTIYDNNSIKISGLNEDEYITDGNKIIITKKQGSVEFCISLEGSATSGDVCIDTLYSDKFTGLKFVFEEPQEGYYLKLFNIVNETLVVPAESFLKFDSSSVGSSLEQFDYINCGTSTELID